MKKKIIALINNVIFLLKASNFNKQANWFMKRQLILKKSKEGSKDFTKVMKEIKGIIAGMGSFDDLSLIPKNNEMTGEEARKKQTEIIEKFDIIFQEYTKNIQQ